MELEQADICFIFKHWHCEVQDLRGLLFICLWKDGKWESADYGTGIGTGIALIP